MYKYPHTIIYSFLKRIYLIYVIFLYITPLTNYSCNIFDKDIEF